MARRIRGFSLLLLSLLPLNICYAWVLPRSSQAKECLTFLAAERKFSQPAFRQAAHQPTKRKFGADSKIAALHEERIKSAGRVGTKRYVNPSKVFVGNMSFDVDEKQLEDWMCEQMAQPAGLLLHECKVIKDWKTGKSKGFGFAVFTEPIYATTFIEKCNRAEFAGRRVTVNQGKKKQDTTVYIKKKKRAPLNAEEEAIMAGMAEAAEFEAMDAEEVALLRALDPDLLPDTLKPSEGGQLSDEVLFQEFASDGDDDDDDEGVDGVWYGDDDEIELDSSANMNREQRRNAAKNQKRKKLPHTGFSPAP